MKIFRWTDTTYSLMDNELKPLKSEIAGWLVEEHDDYILVASERMEELGYRQFTAIPRFALDEKNGS